MGEVRPLVYVSGALHRFLPVLLYIRKEKFRKEKKEMKRNIYTQSRFDSAIILGVMGLLFLVLLIESLFSGQGFSWSMLFLSLALEAVSAFCFLRAIRFRKECEECKEKGEMYDGVVIERHFDLRFKVT